MPKVPKWMANAMESIFSGMYHSVQVTVVEDVENGLRKVRFEGDFSKSKRAFVAGNVIEFRINDTEFRHYTPSDFNMEKGYCDVLFYLHDKGPGSKWVTQLQVGDELKLLGPGGKVKYDNNASIQVAFGDETSVGLVECIANEAKTHAHSFYGVIELSLSNKDWQHVAHIGAVAASKEEETPATDSIRILEEWMEQRLADKLNMAFYLTGNALSIVAVKKFLLANGIKNTQIQTEPYWAEGKQGL